jgi:transposase InsO family protein
LAQLNTAAHNQLNHQFAVNHPNQRWVSDIAFIHANEGFFSDQWWSYVDVILLAGQ